MRSRHALVGDVRGLGLFVGVELVRDRETREPAGAEAGIVANRMRDRGVLVSTDGPFHNVLKIKPPLCFTERDADRLASTLDDILARGLPAGVTRAATAEQVGAGLRSTRDGRICGPWWRCP